MKVKLLDPRAKAPTVERPAEDLGYDLYSLDDVILRAGITTKVRTGIAVEFDKGWGGIIKDRSSMASKGIVTSAGVIDNGYRGEIVVLLTFHPSPAATDFKHAILAGDRIAQILPCPANTWKTVLVVKELSETSRGEKGFGSSGK